MKRTPVTPDISPFPKELHSFFSGSAVYDSSSSPEAKVFFLEKNGGYYLKTAKKGTLEREAQLTAYFHEKGLAPDMLAYISLEHDFMLTSRVPGEDMTFRQYLDEPKKLCDKSAELLRSLHETDFSACPVKDHTAHYLSTAQANFEKGAYDLSFAPWFKTAKEAYAYLFANAYLLKNEVLLHGDYCLPNVMLDNWHFTGFIDVGNGGVGDRHVDLYWGAWTLCFNLGTDAYRARFLDAYGRDRAEEEKLRIIAAAEVFG